MSSVVKLGTWGAAAPAAGDDGAAGSVVAHDIAVAPQRLESITIRYGKVIDSISFTYRDRDKKLHTAGPWGGAGGPDKTTITLGPSEYVTEVAWSVGPFKFRDVETVVETCITSLKFVTNQATYGPFGPGLESTQHSLPVLNNASVVGMFARAGDYIEAVGFYVLPF